MSAPQIPNLQTLRRGGLRSRGRGGDVSNPGTGSRRRPPSKDEIIQRTDTDAATSRVSAVQAGYLEDPFAKHLLNDDTPPRRLPLMNRGTYVRTSAIDQIVGEFLSLAHNGDVRQIISLGAGSDTRFFRLKQKHPDANIVYHEIDFEANTIAKISRLKSPHLAEHIRQLCRFDTMASTCNVERNESSFASNNYYIHPHDLRNLPPSPEVLGIDRTHPTLIISECCLCYLSPNDALQTLEYFNKYFKKNCPLAIVIYEPIRPHDAFGRTMVENLMARGIQLQTLEKFAELKDQKARLTELGFDDSHPGSGSRAADIDFIWRTWIDQNEKERIEGLEWMDEMEEFVLLTKHYCLAWGWKNYATNTTGWGSLPGSDI